VRPAPVRLVAVALLVLAGPSWAAAGRTPAAPPSPVVRSATVPSPVAGPAYGGPAVAAGPRVTWPPPGAAPAPPPVRPPGRGRGDSLRALRELADYDALRPAALRRLAAMLFAGGDSAGAERAWSDPALAGSIWALEGLRPRVERALGRGDLGLADSLVRAVDAGGWPEAERAAVALMAVRVALARGDTAAALAGARSMVRRYPALWPARSALQLWERVAAARGEPLAAEDAFAAADLELLQRQRTQAVARLTRLAAGADPALRSRALARRADAYVALGRHREAVQSARAALAAAPDAAHRSRAWLALARAERTAGHTGDMLDAYERAAREAPDDGSRAAAWRERGRAAEGRRRWAEALHSHREDLALSGREEASFRAGLMHLALGDADSARASWRGGQDEPSRFWWAVATRARDRRAADSAFAVLADRPGYGFYRSAARDSLGRPGGWPGTLARAECGGPPSCRALEDARMMAVAGFPAEAVEWLTAWTRPDPRLDPGITARSAEQVMAAVAVGYALGQLRPASRWADNALAAADSAGERLWGYAPWAFPPAYDSLFAAIAPGGTIDAPLLAALTRVESRFDPVARSSSDALGLMQLKLSTARDAAGWRGERVGREADLFDPARNITLGTRYLGWLLGRFDGWLSPALAAYNIGPGALPDGWRELVARGGDALFCELGAPPGALDYARRILAGRRAYRELRPAPGAAGP
jgi:soluble lytic murein transglycosylase-like protein